jgi:hypothetical protein
MNRLDAATGQCISAIGSSVTITINTNATPTFAIFVSQQQRGVRSRQQPHHRAIHR